MAAGTGIAVLWSGVLPPWYLLAGFGRYLFGAALFLEARLGRRLRELPPSPFRRRLAGFQMGLVTVCLAPFVEPEWAPPATLALGVPFLLGFGRDYLIASGRLDPDSAASRRFLSRLARLRSPASGAAAVLAAALGVAKLAGLPTGSWFLAAFFFACVVRRAPARRPAWVWAPRRLTGYGCPAGYAPNRQLSAALIRRPFASWVKPSKACSMLTHGGTRPVRFMP